MWSTSMRTNHRSFRRKAYIASILSLLIFLLVACAPSSEAERFTQKSTSADSARANASPTSAPALARMDLLPGDWPTYMRDNARSGLNDAETHINVHTASRLKEHWHYHAKRIISSQPVVAFGLIYWSSWDGAAHATNLNGQEVWETNLGTSNTCSDSIGPADTATATVLQHGQTLEPAILLGGGNASFYALDAADGHVLWKTPLGVPPSEFIYSSPVVYNGSAYVGLASFGDCPAIQGRIFQIDVNTGAIQHVFEVVPHGCRGGGVWGSPAIDGENGVLYVATGSPDACWLSENYVSAVLALRLSDLQLIDSWQVPHAQWTIDSDFGSTPTLFTARMYGSTRNMLGLIHKNGIYYALDRDHLRNGPVWERQLSDSYGCAKCGSNTFTSSAWDGTYLYAAANKTTMNGSQCASSLRALDPSTGNFVWQHCLTNGLVYEAVTVIPGVVIVGNGAILLMLAARTGTTLFTFNDTKSGALFYGAATVSNGMLYIGGAEGILWAFGL